MKKWKHNCTKCQYLMSTVKDKQKIDIYKSCENSLLLRIGNQPEDYMSLPVSCVNAYVSELPDSVITYVIRMLISCGKLKLKAEWSE